MIKSTQIHTDDEHSKYAEQLEGMFGRIKTER